jgi:hypothetical protein
MPAIVKIVADSTVTVGDAAHIAPASEQHFGRTSMDWWLYATRRYTATAAAAPVAAVFTAVHTD